MDLPFERIGPYRLTRWIGSGGVGHAFAAGRAEKGHEGAPELPSPGTALGAQPLARLVPGGRTRVQTGTPAFLGTAAYMAPEQCRNVAEVTDRADVYSLGLILFELITGKPPFDSAEPVELMSMHMQVEPPHLEKVAQDVSPALG